MNIYQENGYESREDYLICLADDYDLSLETVKALAIDPDEDFDMLVIMCQGQADLEWGD